VNWRLFAAAMGATLAAASSADAGIIIYVKPPSPEDVKIPGAAPYRPGTSGPLKSLYLFGERGASAPCWSPEQGADAPPSPLSGRASKPFTVDGVHVALHVFGGSTGAAASVQFSQI
jgi:hypothetical protein